MITETHNPTLARKACLMLIERDTARLSAHLNDLRVKHGRSGTAAAKLSKKQSRHHFLIMGGDPFMRVFT